MNQNGCIIQVQPLFFVPLSLDQMRNRTLFIFFCLGGFVIVFFYSLYYFKIEEPILVGVLRELVLLPALIATPVLGIILIIKWIRRRMKSKP